MRNNRLSPYEAGWLSFLVESGIADREAALEAQRRVALAAWDALQRRSRKKKRKKRRDE